MIQSRRTSYPAAARCGACAIAAYHPCQAIDSTDLRGGSLTGQSIAGQEGPEDLGAGGDGGGIPATINPIRRCFCASSFKGFVLAEFLRQMEAGETSLLSCYRRRPRVVAQLPSCFPPGQ